MTPEEWEDISALMAVNWPHAVPPPEAFEKWGYDLQDEPGEEVLAAVEAIYRDGERFPPNGGQILVKLAELRRPEPNSEEAAALIIRAAGRFGAANWEGAREWLPESAALAAERFGWREICHWENSEGTLRAQLRKIYEGVSERRRQSERYEGLPGGDSLPAVPAPRRVGEIAASIKESRPPEK
jgi:hypothetical protein